jgi:hypothetical protein
MRRKIILMDMQLKKMKSKNTVLEAKFNSKFNDNPYFETDKENLVENGRFENSENFDFEAS